MYIKNIKIDNFRSLKDFDTSLSKDNTLLNYEVDCETNSIIDIFHFLKFSMKNGNNYLLNNNFSRDIEIPFAFSIKFSNDIYYNAIFSDISKKFIYEVIFIIKDGIEKYFLFSNEQYYRLEDKEFKYNFAYSSSIMSILSPELLHPQVLEVKKFISNIRILTNYSDNYLRFRTKDRILISKNQITRPKTLIDNFINNINYRQDLLGIINKIYNISDIDVEKDPLGFYSIKFTRDDGLIFYNDSASRSLLEILATALWIKDKKISILVIDRKIDSRLLKILKELGCQILYVD